MTRPKKSDKALTFEAAAAELEELVSSLEGSELPLEEAVAAYKRGVELIKLCNEKLQAAREQVQVLDGDLLKTFSGKADDE